VVELGFPLLPGMVRSWDIGLFRLFLGLFRLWGGPRARGDIPDLPVIEVPPVEPDDQGSVEAFQDLRLMSRVI
jgi:hypothetical protein